MLFVQSYTIHLRSRKCSISFKEKYYKISYSTVNVSKLTFVFQPFVSSNIRNSYRRKEMGYKILLQKNKNCTVWVSVTIYLFVFVKTLMLLKR